MKGLRSFALFILIFTAAGCNKDEFTFQVQSCQYSGQIIDNQVNGNGRIYKVGDFWVIDLIINDKITRCSPCNLPNELKIESRYINLDANIHPLPANVKMVGQPIEITKVY